MPVSRHKVYERASKYEDGAFLSEAIDLVKSMPKPRGWTERERRGRPKKDGPGRPIEYEWQPVVVILMLMQYYGVGYREISAHVRSRPDLMKTLELEKAPSKSTLQRAHTVLTPSWLEELNTRVLARFKKGGVRQRNGSA